jgi:hypothetical protein
MMPDHINFDRAPIGQTTSPDHRKCPKGKPVGQWAARSGFSRRALVGHLAPKAGNRADYGPAARAHFAEVIPGPDDTGLSTGLMRLNREVAQRRSNVTQRHWLVGPVCGTAPLAPRVVVARGPRSLTLACPPKMFAFKGMDKSEGGRRQPAAGRCQACTTPTPTAEGSRSLGLGAGLLHRNESTLSMLARPPDRAAGKVVAQNWFAGRSHRPRIITSGSWPRRRSAAVVAGYRGDALIEAMRPPSRGAANIGSAVW